MICPTVTVVAAEYPEFAANIALPSSLTCRSRPGNRPVHRGRSDTVAQAGQIYRLNLSSPRGPLQAGNSFGRRLTARKFSGLSTIRSFRKTGGWRGILTETERKVSGVHGFDRRTMALARNCNRPFGPRRRAMRVTVVPGTCPNLADDRRDVA